MATAEPSLKREPKDCAAQLAAIAGQAVRMTAANGAAIAVRQNDQVVTVASFGDSVPGIGMSVRSTSFAGRCIVEQKLLVCDDTETDPSVDAAACRTLKVRSMIAAPVTSDGQTIGVLAVFASWPHAFVENRIGLIRTLAGIAGELIALEQSRPPEAEKSAPVEPAPPAQEAPQALPTSSKPEPALATETLPATELAYILAMAAPEQIVSVAPEPQPTVVEATPEEANAAPSHPLALLSPEELSSQLRNGPSKDDLLLFPSFSPSQPESHRVLKVTIVLIVVAVLAAGQWFMRGRIVGAVRKYVIPRIHTIHPAQPAPVAVPPASVSPKPVTTLPAPEPKLATAAPAPQQSAPAPVEPDKAKPGRVPTPAPGKPQIQPKAPQSVSSGAIPSELRPPHLLRKVEPVDPPDLKTEGTVVLNATVLKDGSIGKITVVTGDPALRGAAVAAVKQWQYRPAYQNGQPVAVTVDVEVPFRPSN